MNKVHRTPVPLPGSNKNSQSKRPPPKQPLSQEIVDSSDDAAVEDAPPPKASVKAAKKQKETVSIAVHRPKTNGTVKKTPVPVPSEKQRPKPAVSQTKDTETTSSSDSDDSTTEDAPTTQVNGSGTSAKTTSESESESSSGTSDEDSEEESAPEASQSKANDQASKVAQSHTVEFRPAQPYVPPKGFSAVTTPLNTSSKPTNLFENLEGKEIWHITAPADVSLATLQEVALSSALNGEAVLSHKGSEYGFSAAEKGDEGARQILIPKQNGYTAVSNRISKTLHLHQVLRLPNLTSKQADPNTGSEAAASITRSTIRAPRPQIKGLKMRYFHSGFGDEEPGTIGSSDSEAEASVPAGLGVMNATQPRHKAEKKRKHHEVNGEAPLPSPKKHKKHRTAEEIKKREEKKAKKERKRGKERSIS